MKKYTKGVIAALAITFMVFFVNTVSAKGGELITNKGYDFVVNPENKDIVLKPGITCGQWTQVLERFTMAKFGKSLKEVRNGSTVEDNFKSKYLLYNTYYINGTAKAFGPVKEIKKSIFVYNGQPWLVLQCGQMISTDAGLINNAINGKTVITEPTPKDTTKKQQNQKNKDSMQQTTEHMKGFLFVTQPTNTNNEWLPALIILAILAIIALVIIALVAKDNRRNATIQQNESNAQAHRDVIAEQTAHFAALFSWIGQFENAKNMSNINAASNAQQVHNVWRNVNYTPPNTQQPNNPPASETT